MKDFESQILPFDSCVCLFKHAIIYFEYVDFGPKMYLLLYPTLGNLTTHITTINNQWLIIGCRQKVVLKKLAEDGAEFLLCYVRFCGYLASCKKMVKKWLDNGWNNWNMIVHRGLKKDRYLSTKKTTDQNVHPSRSGNLAKVCMII